MGVSGLCRRADQHNPDSALTSLHILFPLLTMLFLQTQLHLGVPRGLSPILSVRQGSATGKAHGWEATGLFSNPALTPLNLKGRRIREQHANRDQRRQRQDDVSGPSRAASARRAEPGPKQSGGGLSIPHSGPSPRLPSLPGLAFLFSSCPSLHAFKSLLVGVCFQSLPEPSLSKPSFPSVPTAPSTALICAMTQVVQVSVLSGGKILDSNTGSVPLLLDDYGQVTSPLCFFYL